MDMAKWEKKVGGAISKELGLRVKRLYSEHDFYTFSISEGTKLTAKQRQEATKALKQLLAPGWICGKFTLDPSLSFSTRHNVYIAAIWQKN